MSWRCGAGAVLLAEEAIPDATRQHLATLIAGQPPWSDLPVLVMTRKGADSRVVAEAIGSLGNVTLLERPTRVSMLLGAVRTAVQSPPTPVSDPLSPGSAGAG